MANTNVDPDNQQVLLFSCSHTNLKKLNGNKTEENVKVTFKSSKLLYALFLSFSSQWSNYNH